MSAEVENNKDETIKEKEKERKTVKERTRENWQTGVKILELIVCGICLGFISEPNEITGLGNDHIHHMGVIYTTFAGYILINLIFLISRTIGDRTPYRTIAIFAFTGGVFFIISGILLIVVRTSLAKNRIFHPHLYLLNMLVTAIVFAFVNAVLFTIEGVFTLRLQEDY